MDGSKRNGRDWEIVQREVHVAKSLRPLDQHIDRLRGDIRWQIDLVRQLRTKGFDRRQAEKVLGLLCRTLEAERSFRKALLRSLQ